MSVTIFFLKDIRTPGFRESLSQTDAVELDNYLEEMRQGPADGEMDLMWQETGKGYYLHDHILAELKTKLERDQFLLDLHEDIKTWLSKTADNYMVKQARNKFFPETTSLDA